MKRAQVDKLIHYLQLKKEDPYLIETHISWIILTREYAYKFKKEVQFSFLDFSNLEQRKYYCERELQLNQRLAPQLYLAVVPVCEDSEDIVLEGTKGTPIDYAVKMKRVDNRKEMGNMLEQDLVTPQHMEQLADQLATFHRFAQKVKRRFDEQKTWDNFADILQHRQIILQTLSSEGWECIVEAVKQAKIFLAKYRSRFLVRNVHEYTIDGHGDLHTGNIFLEKEPIIFDCIEFNDQFRTVDVLDELAFICMDLEAHGKASLAQHFLQQYLDRYPCMPHEADPLLFLYYKLYRANVRIKVTLIKWQQAKGDLKQLALQEQIHSYYAVFCTYLEQLREGGASPYSPFEGEYFVSGLSNFYLQA